MEKNRDTQTWFWEFPGNVKLTVPSADFKRGGKELLQAVRKIFGDGLKDMYLQDVHYNLPIGANRIKLENNMTALLTEYVDRHPLKSYRTLAEDDKFVVIGDTLSPDIRAYRKLSENEVSKVLLEYATKEDLSLVPMDKELQVLASKIEQKEKEPKYYSQVAFLQFEEDTREFDHLQNKEDYKGILKIADAYDQGDGISQRDTFKNPEHYRGDDLLDEDDRYAVVYNNSIGGTYSIFRKITEEDVRRAVVENGLDPYASADVREVFDRYWAEKTANEKIEETKQHRPPQMVTVNGEQLHLASAYQKYSLPPVEGIKIAPPHKTSDGSWVISASIDGKGQTPERKLAGDDLYSLFKSKTATIEQLAAKYLMDDIRSILSEKRDVSSGIKIK